MLGSLTVALYLVSRCVEHIMGQVLTRMTPGWLAPADGAAPAHSNGTDECGYRLRAPSRAVHHVALHADEEMVIRETQQPERAANGAVLPPHAEAVLVEHHASLPGQPVSDPVLAKSAIKPTVDPAVEPVVEPLIAAAVAAETGAVRPRGKRPLYAADDHQPQHGAEAPGGEPEPKRRQPDEFETLIRSEYPFLDDPETVDYLRTSKVMFVLKGLPGSGKSHLARRIAQTYPGTVVCTADDFFMKDGRYEFDQTLLREAHKACQERAEQACIKQRGHIVVDNSCLRDWEWKVYARLASRHHYLLLLQEPQTAWRRDPARLALYNSHHVTEQEIRNKKKSMQDTVPLYYGWFLNAADCRDLLGRVKNTLETMYRSDAQFREEFCMMTGSEDITDLECLYRPPAELLHCTARFCGGRSRAAAARLYGDRPEVRRALGSLSTARLTGLLLTPRTLCGRLTIDDDQLKLWSQPDWQTKPKPPKRQSDGPASDRPPEWQAGPAQPSLAVSGSKRPVRTARGRRAHVTLGCRPGWPSVTAGLDLLSALDRLESSPELLRRPAATAGRATLYQLERHVWYLDLHRDLVVDVVFSGRYQFNKCN